MPSNLTKNPNESEKSSHKPKKGINAITIFSFIILIIIVVTFIGAPVASNIAGQPSMSFGSYDGIDINFQQGNVFSKQVENLNRQYEQYNFGNVDMLRQIVWQQAFQQTATQIALEHEALLAGVIVTEKLLDRALVKNPAYNVNGKFSDEAYRTTPSSEKLNIRTTARTNLTIQQYYYDIAAGVKVSNADRDFIAAMQYPQRKFSFVVFDDKDFPDAQVAEYGLKNKDLFRTINLSRLTITSSEGDANKVQAEAAKGDKPFEDLVKIYSKDSQAEAGGAMNLRTYNELKSDFDKPADLDALFALKKGDISSVIKTPAGWSIYKVIEASADADMTNGATLASVRTYIGRSEKGLLQDYLEKLAATLRAEIKDGKLTEAAAKIGKAVETTDFVSLNFNNLEFFPKLNGATKNAVFGGLSANDDFFKKAWALKTGEISAPVLASPSVLLLKLEEIKDTPAAPVTKEEKDRIVSSFVQERAKLVESDILKSPKFKDEFKASYEKHFTKANQ